MKKISIAFLFFMGTYIQACNNRDENGSTDTSNTNSSKSVTDSTRGNMPASNSLSQTGVADKESADFVMNAASGGMLEVQLGQLAEQNAKSQRVKNFGSMMVADHSKANDELESLASSNNIIVSATLLPDHQKHLDMMKNKSGADFDNAYMSMMVDDHKEDISEFKREANSSNNNAFKDFASKALPVLQKHLDSAQAIHGKM